MSLYFILLLVSFSVPFLLSFDKRLQFYKSWKYVFPALFITAAIFITFDVFLTQEGVWGFTPRYLSGTFILDLPIEEWLFFFAISYASLFLHYSIVEYFPTIRLKVKTAQILSIVLILLSITIALIFVEKTYTFYISIKLVIILLLSLLINSSRAIRSFFVTFLVILVPFIIVNGMLTGSFIEGEVVWYNNEENLGVRIFTIPIEDFAYAFSLIFLNLLIIEKSKEIATK